MLRSTVDNTTLTWSVEMNSLELPIAQTNVGLASSETPGAGQMGVISHLETGIQVPASIQVNIKDVQCYLNLESGSLTLVIT